MTARNSRLVGLAAVGALAAGLLAAPPVLAAGASSVDGPQFVKMSSSHLATGGASTASAVESARLAHARVVAKVSQSSGEQVLQSIKGRNNIGADGIGVAAGPKHVLQVGANGASVFLKSTGKLVKGYASLNQLFGINGSIALSEPTVAYDPVGKRFVVVAITNDAGDIGIAVRVSKQTVPTKWFGSVRYADSTTSDSNSDVNESMPKVGVSADKLAITAVADDPTDTAVANRILFIPKQLLYKNVDPGAWVADVNNTYDGQAPAVNATSQANAFIAIPDVTDVTVTTYTGASTVNPPNFSKSVMYPAQPLVAPPVVDQGAGDDLNLGPLAFGNASWRSGKLFTAAATDCAGESCIRVFGITTKFGVALSSDDKLLSTGHDLFSPTVAIDGASKVHVAVNDVASGTSGPSFAVFARKGASNWTGERFVAKGVGAYSGTGNPTDWNGGTAAAIDPTAPWDAWITGAYVKADSLASRVARVSLAKNLATLKASDKNVRKGTNVTFTAKLSRPGGDRIKGLPIALQKKPVHGGNWSTVSSKKTSAKGTAKWTLKIRKAANYRTLGKPVLQTGGQGRVVASAASKALKVSLT